MAVLRIKEVIKKTGLCKSSIYAHIQAGAFPKQIKLTQRSSGWLESEIDQWLADRIAERDREAL